MPCTSVIEWIRNNGPDDNEEGEEEEEHCGCVTSMVDMVWCSKLVDEKRAWEAEMFCWGRLSTESL